MGEDKTRVFAVLRAQFLDGVLQTEQTWLIPSGIEWIASNRDAMFIYQGYWKLTEVSAAEAQNNLPALGTFV